MFVKNLIYMRRDNVLANVLIVIDLAEHHQLSTRSMEIIFCPVCIGHVAQFFWERADKLANILFWLQLA